MFKIALLISGFITFLAIFWGWTAVGAALALLLFILLVWVIGRWIYIRIPEMEVAVVFNSERKAFARFLPPGRHWLIPFWERIEVTIATAPTITRTTCEASLNGGVPLSIKWTLSYCMDPLIAPTEMHSRIARLSSDKVTNLIQAQVNNRMRAFMQQYTLDGLNRAGARDKIERQLKHIIAARLAPFGISIFSVMIDQITMPQKVQQALEEAVERAVQVESEAGALERLQGIVGALSERDMQRLNELERMRLLGKNGVSLLLPISSLLVEDQATSRPDYHFTTNVPLCARIG